MEGKGLFVFSKSAVRLALDAFTLLAEVGGRERREGGGRRGPHHTTLTNTQIYTQIYIYSHTHTHTQIYTQIYTPTPRSTPRSTPSNPYPLICRRRPTPTRCPSTTCISTKSGAWIPSRISY